MRRGSWARPRPGRRGWPPAPAPSPTAPAHGRSSTSCLPADNEASRSFHSWSSHCFTRSFLVHMSSILFHRQHLLFMFTFEASDQSITYEIGSLSRVSDSEQEKWILCSSNLKQSLEIFNSSRPNQYCTAWLLLVRTRQWVVVVL